MAGWNLTEGRIAQQYATEEELKCLFNFVFSNDSKKRTSYKFGLIKAILDNLLNVENGEFGLFLSYKTIFSKFAENYWNLIIKYNLCQIRKEKNSEQSAIEKIFLKYQDDSLYGINIDFNSIEKNTREKIILSVEKACKKNVIGALYSDFDGKLYSFDLKGNGIYLSYSAFDYMFKHKVEIETQNYYSWARFLESVNDDNVLLRITSKLDMSTPKRSNLSIYREILYVEFEEQNCFYCGCKLNRMGSVDHFIPWSFVKEDKLWNFVLACKTCNSKKNDKIPDEYYFRKIIIRNNTFIQERPEIKNTYFRTYSNELYRKIWEYSKSCGLKIYSLR